MIGALRTRATLQTKTQVPDGGGGFTESWSPLATVWCAVEPLAGSVEAVSADQSLALKRVRVRLRFRDDVTEALRLMIGARVFGIEAVSDPDGRRRWLDLLCVENTPS